MWEEGHGKRKSSGEGTGTRGAPALLASPVPKQCGVTAPHEDGTKGLQWLGRVPWAPCPCGGHAGPAAPPPPAPTPALLTARSFITNTLLHTHSTPVPGLPGTHPAPPPAPELQPSASRVFPSSQVLNSLLSAPSPRQSIPVRAAAAIAASPHCSTQSGQAAAGHGSVRGAPHPQKWGSPILAPPERTAPS